MAKPSPDPYGVLLEDEGGRVVDEVEVVVDDEAGGAVVAGAVVGGAVVTGAVDGVVDTGALVALDVDSVVGGTVVTGASVLAVVASVAGGAVEGGGVKIGPPKRDRSSITM